jgi:hypothetical protein
LSGHAIAGLVLLNTVLFVVGMSVLWSLRGFATWDDVLRLSGLAYLLGVASLGAVLVFELAVGIPVGLIGILVSSLLLCAGALAAGFAVGRARPSGLTSMRLATPTAVFAALVIVYFQALFRAGRLGGLYEWDGWAFWVPKGKAIYYFGGLDAQFFGELPGPTYPPLVPALQAVAFHFMGSADQVTLHLQFWFFYLGFVGAVIGLLCTRVRPLLLWPPVLLMLCTPFLSGGELTAQGDILLDELLIAATLLIGLWLLEREPWQLYAATLLLGGAFLTKREGYLIAFCVIAAALVASRLEGRRVGWRPLLLTAAAAFAVSIPWLVWFRAQGFGGGGPAAGGFGLLEHLDRAWPSYWLAVSTFFDFHLFLVTGELALLAILLAFVAGERTLPAYVGLALVLCIAGFTWITWSFPEIPIDKESPLNPITRVTMSIVMMAAVFTPLLLQAAWDASTRMQRLRRPVAEEPT